VADCLAVDCGREPPAALAAPRSYAGVELQARDYDSLLRALLDGLPRLAPGWRDRSEADLGIVLLELLAYAADQGSYLQDRVALEGFLRTATQHESVRKLLRLVDYAMDPGAAAQALLLFDVTGAAPLFLPAGFAVRTRPDPAAGPQAAAVVYETRADVILVPALSGVALALDAPSSADGRQAALAADLAGSIAPGMRLLFEQGEQREWAIVAAAVTGAVTTLTLAQPLAGRYTVAADPALGLPATLVSGNTVEATHGESHAIAAIGTGRPAQRIELELAPLTWLAVDGAAPVPALRVEVDGVPWTAVEDFIDSTAADRHYRFTRDNDANVTLHFGDGVRAAIPPVGADIAIDYRVGIGSDGQVAPGALTQFDAAFAFPDASQRILGVRNPFAATGARDPETMDQARLLGPYQLRRQERAVVPADYEACLAQGVRAGDITVVPVQSKARFRATGSWTTVFVSADLPGRRPLAATPGLRAAFEALLQQRKLAGVDVRVEDARYCPLHIALRVEVDDGHFARDVRSAVEQALAGPLVDRVPFFGPGRFRFGQAVHLSDLYAAAMAVAGVRSVAVTRFKRLGDRYPDREAQGFIEVGALEVARCDNDAAATGNGVLFVRTRGGKEG
jgi:hypothetical protein